VVVTDAADPERAADREKRVEQFALGTVADQGLRIGPEAGS
jgi:hypothetical protein